MYLANVARHYLNAMLKTNKNAVGERLVLAQQSQQFVTFLLTSIDWITGFFISKWARAHLLVSAFPCAITLFLTTTAM